MIVENISELKKASNKRPHIVWFHGSETPQRGKSTKTERRVVVA
jgi:hypothetical protein